MLQRISFAQLLRTAMTRDIMIIETKDNKNIKNYNEGLEKKEKHKRKRKSKKKK